MVYIYILKLQSNKYYIGKTTNPKFRLDSHFNYNGSVWTKKYKPINIHQLIPDCDNFDEDKHTLKYMEKYGINNVRGGSFCKLTLSNENKKTIEKMINSSTDKCYKCGEKGHFVSNCPYESDEEITIENLAEAFAQADKDDGIYEFNNKKYLWNNGKLSEESHNGKWKPISQKGGMENNYCNRCNRKGHNENNCYAKTYDDGNIISDSDNLSTCDSEEEVWNCNYCGKEFNSKKGATYHENIYCKMKKKTKKGKTKKSNYYSYNRDEDDY